MRNAKLRFSLCARIFLLYLRLRIGIANILFIPCAHAFYGHIFLWAHGVCFIPFSLRLARALLNYRSILTYFGT